MWYELSVWRTDHIQSEVNIKAKNMTN